MWLGSDVFLGRRQRSQEKAGKDKVKGGKVAGRDGEPSPVDVGSGTLDGGPLALNEQRAGTGPAAAPKRPWEART